MRVAIVHDWLVDFGGAERVLARLLKMHTGADLFTLFDFMEHKNREFLSETKIKTSFLQKIPFCRKFYRKLLPLMPIAIEQFDLSDYDLVISSSHAVAKGIIVHPHQRHICLCYSPIRYAWDMQFEYFRAGHGKSMITQMLMRYFLHKIRIWDARTAHGVDQFVAISQYIRARIRKVYGRDAEVIYPPVDTKMFDICKEKEEFYLCASRLVPYKNIPLIIETFRELPTKRLVVIGDGPDLKKCKKMATSNITVMGFQSAEILTEHMQKAKAFIYAACEDFGIVVVEAQASGTPVIAYGRGASRETLIFTGEQRSGVLFDELSTNSLKEAIVHFEENSHLFAPEHCRASSIRFTEEIFDKNWMHMISARPN